MTALSLLRSRPWTMPVVLAGLVAVHAILFQIVRRTGMSHAGVSGALISGLVLLIIAKHLGLFAGLLRALHGRFRQRLGNRKSGD